MQHKCYKCGTEFDGNFCPECGEKWLENKTCPKCGATLAGNAKFCNNCGFSFLPKPQPAPQPSQKTDAAPKPQPAPPRLSAPIAPQKILKPEKPQKPVKLISRSIVPEDKRGELIPEMVKHIKRKRTLASLLGFSFSIFFIIFYLFLGINESTIEKGMEDLIMNGFGNFLGHSVANAIMSYFYIPCIAVPMWYVVIPIVFPALGGLVFILSVCFITWSRKGKPNSWRSDKIYCIGKLNSLFAFYVINFIAIIVSTIYTICEICEITLLMGRDWAMPHRISIVAGGGISFLLFIPSLILYLKTVKQRKALCVKLCGAESIKKSPLVEEYQKELSEYNTKLKNYQLKKKDYQENRRAWTVYEYQKKRFDSGKTYQNITYTRAWLYFHRVALSAASVTLAAVITVTCVLATRDTRFNIDNLVKIGLHADQQAVTEVLGDPFEKQGDVWYYFSKNYMSIQEKMDKAMESDSIEDALEESAALEEKLQTLEYQAIIVKFSGSKVTSMMLDAAAVGSSKLLGVPHEKEVVEQSLSKTSFRLGDTADSAYYTVSYSDGSYCMAYLPAIQLTEEGEQTIKWTNVWGTYTATVTVRK